MGPEKAFLLLCSALIIGCALGEVNSKKTARSPGFPENCHFDSLDKSLVCQKAPQPNLAFNLRSFKILDCLADPHDIIQVVRRDNPSIRSIEVTHCEEVTQNAECKCDDGDQGDGGVNVEGSGQELDDEQINQLIVDDQLIVDIDDGHEGSGEEDEETEEASGEDRVADDLDLVLPSPIAVEDAMRPPVDQRPYVEQDLMQTVDRIAHEQAVGASTTSSTTSMPPLEPVNEQMYRTTRSIDEQRAMTTPMPIDLPNIEQARYVGGPADRQAWLYACISLFFCVCLIGALLPMAACRRRSPSRRRRQDNEPARHIEMIDLAELPPPLPAFYDDDDDEYIEQ